MRILLNYLAASGWRIFQHTFDRASSLADGVNHESGVLLRRANITADWHPAALPASSHGYAPAVPVTATARQLQENSMEKSRR
jgi:hypothetical protein